MTIGCRAATSQNTGAAGTIPAQIPAGAVAGDLLLALIVSTNFGTGVPTITGVPAGWSLVTSTNTATYYAWLYQKVCVAGEPGTTPNWNQGSNVSNASVCGAYNDSGGLSVSARAASATVAGNTTLSITTGSALDAVVILDAGGVNPGVAGSTQDTTKAGAPAVDGYHKNPATKGSVSTVVTAGSSVLYFQIAIQVPNQAPSTPGAWTNPTAGQVVPVGVALTLGWGTSTDPDGDSVTYSVQLSDAAGSFASPTTLASGLGTNSYSWTPSTSLPPGAGYKLRAIASDGSLSSGNSDSSAFTIVAGGQQILL